MPCTISRTMPIQLNTSTDFSSWSTIAQLSVLVLVEICIRSPRKKISWIVKKYICRIKVSEKLFIDFWKQKYRHSSGFDRSPTCRLKYNVPNAWPCKIDWTSTFLTYIFLWLCCDHQRKCDVITKSHMFWLKVVVLFVSNPSMTPRQGTDTASVASQAVLPF